MMSNISSSKCCISVSLVLTPLCPYFLSNGLVKVLPDIIHISQTGFIKCRYLQIQNMLSFRDDLSEMTTDTEKMGVKYFPPLFALVIELLADI